MGGSEIFRAINLMNSAAFTLAIAYVIYILANKEKKELKEPGKVLAYVLVILAVIMLVGKVSGYGFKMRGADMEKCPMMKMMQKM